MEFFLLAFPALLSIINPLGGAFIFLGATEALPEERRANLARWVAIHGFVLLNVSIYVGAYVLEFFGISMPVLRVAGGVVVTMTGWGLLQAGEASNDPDAAVHMAGDRSPSQMAFYPLTMPLTTGPGTIAVAISMGTNRPREFGRLLEFVAGTIMTTVAMCALIYALYRYADRVGRLIGPTGTTIVLRLSAFLLFCIGIQVLWNGVHELLELLLEEVKANG
ncbi:MAG: NAAT family transporter [Burkholderiales bacterium]|jgi:multiple antibiotic resistance protein|nr:NAAT family transporter [Burkholderiales bacterium]